MSALFDRIAGLFGARRQAPLPTGNTHPAPAAPAPATDADRIIEIICAAVLKTQRRSHVAIKLAGIQAWENLKNGPEAIQIAVALRAVVPSPQRAHNERSWRVEETRKAIASQLFRKKLPFTADQLAGPVEFWARQSDLQDGLAGLPVLGAVERCCDGVAPEGALRAALEELNLRLTTIIAEQGNTFEVTTLARVNAVLEPRSGVARALPPGPFADALMPWLAALDAADRNAWRALLVHAASAGDKAKPSAKWLAGGQALLAPIGEAGVAIQLIALMEATTPDPAHPDASLDILKGLLWLAAGFAQPGLAGPVGRFVEKCFRKVSGAGTRSIKLGNAGLRLLSETGDGEGAAAELFRLRARLKLPSVQTLLDDRLATLARELGCSVAELEDSSLPTFGLDADAMATCPVGDIVATIALDTVDVETRWHASDGRALKAPPAAVQRDYKAELLSIKQAAKDIEAARAVQALRLEQSWQEDRSWDIAAWRRSFLDHPLRRQIAQALVWRFESPDGPSLDGIPKGSALLTLAGGASIPETATVRLWHPLDSHPEQVLGWRAQIMALGVTQPIKQAHREIYALTDAERRTGTYSNRFAAHILRQHQFAALCEARGWRFELLGGWDSGNVPSKPLPQHRLTIEYHVDAIDNVPRSDAHVPLHIATDKVRFVGADGQAVPLDTVAPILFSEALRDVDLFVAVTSVANDPNWTDGGPEGQFGGYWREWAFGDLSQTAETRRALIATIAPKLAIADRLKITEKFLIVQGQRQEYAIHFGSSNIRILPSNRYLCIIPGPPKDAKAIKLPFAGDSLLSIILRKAFLLVDENRITDPAILRQL